ncbi:hypothetical protein [Haladaptatus caseinilyticus]|uniref:hypothetical protein n=1 Tax=Haladaptatus caseinilyticus TaxID=2993314 RepID=UPI00224AF54F|nr:hypothetical protein [Haladaptatus caseinilyticus]
MRRSSLQTLVLVGVLVIAGCLGVTSTEPPASPSTSAEPEATMGIHANTSYYGFKNTEPNTTYEVTVTVTHAPISAYSVTYVRNGTVTTRTFEARVPANVTDELTVEPEGDSIASQTYTVKPESNIVIRLDGMPEDAALLTTYRVEGERFLRGHGALENGCSQSKLRAYTIVEEESVTNAGCGALAGELSKNVTTYYTLQPTETTS